MNFKFANAIGDESIVTHTAEALAKMIEIEGIHVIYDYDDGSSDAEDELIESPEALVEEYPNISIEDAKKLFAGEAEILDVRVEWEGKPYSVSFCYPIPEITGEDPTQYYE